MILQPNLNYPPILQQPKMAVKYDLGRSWKPKVKPKLGCHINMPIRMCYILVLIMIFQKLTELHPFKCQYQYKKTYNAHHFVSNPKQCVIVLTSDLMSPDNHVILTFDLWSWEVLFRKIFISYAQPKTIITIFTLFPKILVPSLPEPFSLKHEYRVQYSVTLASWPLSAMFEDGGQDSTQVWHCWNMGLKPFDILNI